MGSKARETDKKKFKGG